MRVRLGIVERSVLTMLILILIGLISVDIVFRISCCLQHGLGSASSSLRLMGSGSTFIYPQLKHWINLFEEEHTDIAINYNPSGSGTGQTQLLNERIVDFACSDPPLSHERYEEFKGEILQMPVIVGAIAIVYKIPGYNGPLNLSAEIVAGIYLGVIAYWDDPGILKLNPHAALPHTAIKVIHRSDASGTTQVFTYFLHKAAPEAWPSSLVGKTVNWPIDRTGRGLGAKGNQGVSEYFKALDSAIAYVELGYALENGFSIAAVRNADGFFVKPSEATMTAAVRNALGEGLLPSSPLSDWSNALEAIVYAPGDNSYPVVSFSFLMIWSKYPRAKAEAIKEFIKFINTEGQESIVEGYAPIPRELREINLKSLSLVEGA